MIILLIVLGCLFGMVVDLIVFERRLKSKREQMLKCADFDAGFTCAPPFEASAYLDRMEAVHLQIQETAQPVDWTITLWLGLDGLRIDPDGMSEWIKRRGRAPQNSTAGSCITPMAGLLPPCLFPPPSLPNVSVLYADNRVVEIDAPIDSTMAIQAQIDKLKMENAIMSMEQLIQQTRVTLPFSPDCMQYPQNH